MKYFVIILYIFALVPYAFSNSSALCLVNEDWPDAPCYDYGPVTKERFRNDWASYYDYKGQEWMESKKQELYDVMEKDTFKKWVKDPANANVYTYYVSTGDIPKQSGGHVPMFKSETQSYKLEIIIITLPIIGGGVLGYSIIRHRTRK